MLRTIFLIFQNEFRLLSKDRVGLFMLLLAPMIIIAVAGFSLGNLFSQSDAAYVIPIVDSDHGEVASAIIEALRREPSVTIPIADDLDQARRIVTTRDRAPLAVLIPAGTTEALRNGRRTRLVLLVDPIKRLEMTAVEVRLSQLCQDITARARQRAQEKLASGGAEMRGRLERLAGQLRMFQSELARFREQAERSRIASQRALEAAIRKSAADIEAQTQAAVDRSLQETKSKLAGELAARRDAIAAVTDYLQKLQLSEREFDRWLGALRAAAGSRSSQIPPPPAFPDPPAKAQLAELTKPLELSLPRPMAPEITAPAGVAIKLPALPHLPGPELLAEVESLRPAVPILPGDIGFSERSLTGGSPRINAFDQYVPGFGITFLLVGMLLGLSLGLIDDRDWGTLQRLRVSGAPLAGTLIGKLLSRFLIGLVQLTILYAVGWLMFGVSLGENPVALLMPAVAISFAAAAFGLIIACVARTHDSVMPVGAVVSMAMSAIGGCWWPLDFEPAWMRAIALWMPTTWTMQAFNDLTIRGLSAGSVLWPFAATVGLGLIYLILGLVAASQLYK